MLLFLDTETTGFHSKSKPFDHPDQPHIMQLAWKLITPERRVLRSYNTLIKCPVEPHEKAFSIHGITQAECNDFGIEPERAAEDLEDVLYLATSQIAHNIEFDIGVINLLFARHNIPTLKNPNRQCTMQMAKRLGLPSASLANAYEYLTGKPLEGSHDAMSDTDACEEIYFRMKQTGARPSPKGGN